MIATQRQYQATVQQIKRLSAALERAGGAAPEGVHDVVFQAELAALRSELNRLKEEVELYDRLTSGSRARLDAVALDSLPRALIEARIANGLSQKQLADLLGVLPQQVQRDESTEYHGATFERLRRVADVLGIKIEQNITFAVPVLRNTVEALQGYGLDPRFVEERIAPDLHDATKAYDSLDRICHVFGWSAAELARGGQPALQSTNLGGFRFKLKTGRRTDLTQAYTAYAYHVAQGAAKCTAHMPVGPICTVASAARAAVAERGEVQFRTIAEWAWSLGTVVIPLTDGGAFDGAFWRVGGRNIILLKQRTDSADRLAHDLLHELYHAGQEPNLAERVVLEEQPYQQSSDPEEEAATDFATNVLLDGRANDLCVRAHRLAGGDGRRLKRAVARVADEAGVSVGALANHLAWVLSQQDEPFPWWGVANNLQTPLGEGLAEIRGLAFQNLRPPEVTDPDVDLLFRALRA